ncbi:MAG TPA: hypothetical protein VES73_12550, partial [Lamprocystis sp. (in: g-proteobacteria)]|nr:hypothetical protein [Lamprocystis sp. (in: g-proteobacteria)]
MSDQVQPAASVQLADQLTDQPTDHPTQRSTPAPRSPAMAPISPLAAEFAAHQPGRVQVIR